MAAVRAVLAATLLACGCTSAAPTAPAPLEGTAWAAAEIDGGGVVDGAQSTLLFDVGQKVAGRAACNRYFGTYQQSGDMVEIKPGGTTRMACPPPVMEQESRFLAALGAVRTARREGDTLLLLDSGGRVRVRLMPIARQSAGVASAGSWESVAGVPGVGDVAVAVLGEIAVEIAGQGPGAEPASTEGKTRHRPL